jgi:tetratricopeptide (TPR) repeat protein
MRCLEKDPHRRLRDIGEARVVLSEPQQPVAQLAAPVAAETSSLRRWTIWAALVAGLLVGGVLAVAVILRVIRMDSVNVPAAASASDTGPPRLLVFPFENLSRQTTDEWLAGAFADSLTLGLRDAENVVLVNRERLLELSQGRNSDFQQVARALGVRFYVNGSYQRVGDDLRVTARMVDVDNGTIKLQESFTDRFGNLLQIEDDLAHRFVVALERSPTAARRVQTSSLQAYRSVAQANDLYLDGRFMEAIQQLETATTQDERYAEAWALLGKSYAQLGAPNNVDRSTRSELLDKALRASQRALELDPSLYEAQVALAATYQQLEQVESWRIAAQKAIDLNPRLAEGYVLIGDSYGSSPGFGCARKRDPELAERSYRKALKLNPSFGSAHARLATTFFWSGRDEDALRQSEEALRILPNNISIQRVRAASLAWLGRTDELEQQVRKLATLVPPSILDKWALAVVNLLRGDVKNAAAGFEAAITGGPVIVREIDIGRIYAQVGRMNEAVGHLQHAFVLDSSCVAFVSENPSFAPYRKDPGIKALLSKYPVNSSP